MRPEPAEQPRCKGCGHRRIFHSRLDYVQRSTKTGGRRCVGESMVPCSMPDCGCKVYNPRKAGLRPVDSYLPVRAGASL